jgi:hypothetical protein
MGSNIPARRDMPGGAKSRGRGVDVAGLNLMYPQVKDLTWNPFLNRVPQVRILPGAPSPTTKKAPPTSTNAGQAGLRRVQPWAIGCRRTPLSTGIARARPRDGYGMIRGHQRSAWSCSYPTAERAYRRPSSEPTEHLRAGRKPSVRLQGGPKTGRTRRQLGARPTLTLALPLRDGQAGSRLAGADSLSSSGPQLAVRPH